MELIRDSAGVVCEIRMRRPDNFHAHYRQNGMLQLMVLLFLRYGWGRVEAMPNNPFIDTGQKAIKYRYEAMRIARANESRFNYSEFEMVPSMQITPETTPQMVLEAWRLGVRIFKIYPRFVTTASENGVIDYKALYSVFAEMERINTHVVGKEFPHPCVLSLHPEDPNENVEPFDKESAFIDNHAHDIVLRFPGLPIVFEHISTKALVDFVKSDNAARRNIAATITPQHMIRTYADLLGYTPASNFKLQVDDFCKPVLKPREDRDAVREAAMSGNPKFFYGGDDAPHPVGSKDCRECCAGTFNTDAGLRVCVEEFYQHKKLENLDPFFSESGARFYSFPQNKGKITLRREPSVVPEMHVIPCDEGEARPWLAGETLPWSITAIH
ncbi:MAG: hypothetical protein WDZ82_03950 [Candidatus Paceibacterota bacterium]